MKKFLLIATMLTIALSMTPINNTLATHTATVQWAKEAPADPTYPPHPGEADQYYWNGYTPKWINFTVKNNGPDPIKEIKIIFKKDTDGNSYFNFTETRQKTGWSATPDEFGPNKRPTVLYFHTDNPAYYIQNGETARFDIFFTEGPKSECSYNIDVWTVDAGSTAATTYHQLFVLIDNHLPTVQIITPSNGTTFKEGDVVWVNATASDTEGLHPSGIKKVELWFTYIEKTGTSKPTFVGLMKYDSKNKVYWWNARAQDYLKNEAWHKAVAKAYDYAENSKESDPVMFFWFKPAGITAYTVDPCFLNEQPVGHVGGNAIVKADTGFKPNATVTVKFDTLTIGTNTTNQFGAFILRFQVPELPRKTDPTDPKKTLPYTISATDGLVTYTTNFTIIPWVWVDPKEGYVDDEVTVTGMGFAKNVEVDVIFRDVSSARYFDSWALEWDEGLKLEWKPQLDNLTVTPTLNPPITNINGTFTYKFRIPQSYGGNHPIYGEERKTKVRSGWMPGVTPPPNEPYPQAALFKVKTKIWTVPTMGLTGQFIQIFGDGLPLPRYIEKIYDCKTQKTTIQEHNYYLVLDFGPNKYWVFEKGFILNNEFDYAWCSSQYLPFAYRLPEDDAKQYPDPASPVWSGKLCWQDADKQYHIGSPFLKVPALMPGEYNVTIYQFDATTQTDVYKYKALTTFKVLKDPLYIRVNTGTLYFSGENVNVYAEIDLDGKAADPTTITFNLYRENTLINTLSPQKIAAGLYSASFTCPNEKGNYFIIVNATLDLEGFSLSGFGTASFTVSPTLDGFNATLTAINGNIATINTKIGEINLSLNDLNATIKSIQNGLVDIQTSLGEIKTDLNSINGQIITLSGDSAVIKTDLGTVKSSLDGINANILAIGQNVVEVKTSLGTFDGKISDIQGKTVTIDTRVGTIYTTIDSIKTDTGLQPTNLALSLIAAISAIIAAILIFRKAYA